MPKHKATAKNVTTVLETFASFMVGQNQASRLHVAQLMNKLLDELREDDVFGTEGQCDPRGDQRD